MIPSQIANIVLMGWVRIYPFLPLCAGYRPHMELSLLLIIIGIVVAVLVHYALGIALILIGLVLLLWPRITAMRSTTPSAYR
jgi:hypothetical protein